jgi:formiminotetrahydrofolate cyclodeaminase
MADQTIDEWLDDLGSSKPAPGGGAAAALLVATAAALLEMVANLTIGKPRYAAHEPLMIQTRDQVVQLRHDALAVAADDERAFQDVIAAYRLSKDDPGRTDAIQSATQDAAQPPMRTAALAAAVIVAAGVMVDRSNVNVLSDIAVAVSTARAALESAAVNVEVNLAALRDRDVAATLNGVLVRHLAATDQAQKIFSTVRMGLSR